MQMAYTRPVEDAKDVIARDIAAITRANEIHYELIAKGEDKIRQLTKLLFYCTCPKCGAELAGGSVDAKEFMEAAKSIGRDDAPCAFCDTPEQKKAMEEALELVRR
jgi:hypothetical protein